MGGGILFITMDGMVTPSPHMATTGLPTPQHLQITPIHLIPTMESGIKGVGFPINSLLSPFAVPVIMVDHLDEAIAVSVIQTLNQCHRSDQSQRL